MYLRARQTFGKYVAMESWLHGLDPMVKILLFCLITAAIFLSLRWIHLGCVTAYILVLCRLSKVRLQFYVESLRYFLWMFALSFAINVLFPRGGASSAFTFNAVNTAGIFSVRLALMILAATMLTVTTCPSEIGESFMVLSRIGGRIGRKAVEFASLLAISLRFVPVMFEEAERIRAAQILRGQSTTGLRSRIRLVVGLIVPLIESSLRRATNLGYALEARCYGYRLPKSSGLRIGKHEIVLGGGAIVLVMGVVAMR
jgi:energy-coupling factor transport system permease protein